MKNVLKVCFFFYPISFSNLCPIFLFLLSNKKSQRALTIAISKMLPSPIVIKLKFFFFLYDVCFVILYVRFLYSYVCGIHVLFDVYVFLVDMFVLVPFKKHLLNLSFVLCISHANN